MFKIKNGDYENLSYIPNRRRETSGVPQLQVLSKCKSEQAHSSLNASSRKCASEASKLKYKYQMNELQYFDYLVPQKNLLEPLRIVDEQFSPQFSVINQKLQQKVQSSSIPSEQKKALLKKFELHHQIFGIADEKPRLKNDLSGEM